MLGRERIYVRYLENLMDHSDIIGDQGVVLRGLYMSGTKVVESLIITMHAFDDFVLASGLSSKVEEIIEKYKPSDLEDYIKASGEIKELIKGGQIPEILRQKLQMFYSQISNGGLYQVTLSPSWPEGMSTFVGKLQEKYTFTGISNYEELEKILVEVWGALFDPRLMLERYENKYKGHVSIGVVVSRDINVEASGSVSTQVDEYDSDWVFSVQVILGIFKGIYEKNVTPDVFFVDVENREIEDRSVGDQKFMLVRKPLVRSHSTGVEKVKLSSKWGVQQKVLDEVVLEVAYIAEKVLIQFGNHVNLKWVVSAGRVYITSVSFGRRISSSHSKHEKIIKSKDNTSKSKEVEEHIEQMDEYVKSLQADGEEDSIGKIATQVGKKDKQNGKEGKSQKKKTVDLSTKPELWADVKFAPKGRKSTRGRLPIWLNVREEASVESINSNKFMGLNGIYGEDILVAFGENFDGKRVKEYFARYLDSQFEKFVKSDPSILMIYSISHLTGNLAQKYFGVDGSGIGLHVGNPAVLDIELDAVLKFLEKYKYENLSISLRGVDQIFELEKIRKVIVKKGFEKYKGFRFFLKLNKVPPLLSIGKFLDQNVHGVVLDVDRLMVEILGENYNLNTVFRNSLFSGMLRNVVLECNDRDIVLIVESQLFSYDNERFLMEFLDLGIGGVSINGRQFKDTERILGEYKKKK